MNIQSDKYRLYMKKYQLRRYHAKRRIMLDMLGGVCVSCGTMAELEIDHVDRNRKTMSVERMAYVNEERMIDELQNCQILCKPCHIEKTRLERAKPLRHGTEYAYYNKGCRCKECSEHMKQVRLRRRVAKRSTRAA